jgi:hypothetical protein
MNFKGHLGDKGQREPEAASRAKNVVFDVEYGVTDKLAVSFSLPIVTTRYNSTNPPSAVIRTLFSQTLQAIAPIVYHHDFLDDGAYHSTVTDMQFELRYNLMTDPLVLTPFVGVVIPSHAYAYVGESAPGRNLREFQFGANIGRRLNPFLRKAYVHEQISFAIPQASLGFRTTRMNLSSEFGYFVNRRIAVRGIGNWQHTFDGIGSLAELTTPELELTHERLLKISYWHVGGGVSYSLNPRTDLSVDFIKFLSGRVTHYGSGFNIRITRSFTLKSRRPARLTAPSRVPAQKR